MSALPNLLYKYRSVNDKTLEALRQGKSWFSNRYQLNDPYDCFVRMPKAITVGDMRRLHQLVTGRRYVPSAKSRQQILSAIEASRDPFDRLGLIAEYAQDQQLVDALSMPSPAVDAIWFGSYLALGEFFDAVTVLCLTEAPDNKVMWGNYADSYRGFCIGYTLELSHPLATRLRPVEYVSDASPVDLRAAIIDPVGTRDALVYKKPVDWQYEREWRVTVAGEPALIGPPLRMIEIIFGSSMQQQERELVANAVGTAAVRFRQLRLAYKRGYDLAVTDL